MVQAKCAAFEMHMLATAVAIWTTGCVQFKCQQDAHLRCRCSDNQMLPCYLLQAPSNASIHGENAGSSSVLGMQTMVQLSSTWCQAF